MADSQPGGEPIIIRHRPWVVALVAAGSLAFVAAAPLVVREGLRGGPADCAICAAFALADLLFFGLGLVWSAGALIRRSPAIIIDDRGIMDHSSAIGAGFIAWGEIAAVRLVGAHLLILPIDEPTLLARFPAWRRLFYRANSAALGAPIQITSMALSITSEELGRLIAERSRGVRQPDAD